MSTDTATRLAAYKAAETKILEGQLVRFDGRILQRADLAEVRAAITALEAKLAAENRADAGAFGPVVLFGGFNGNLP